MYTNWVVQKAQKGHPDVTSCTICAGCLHVPCTSSTCRPIRGAYNFPGSLWKMGNPKNPFLAQLWSISIWGFLTASLIFQVKAQHQESAWYRFNRQKCYSQSAQKWWNFTRILPEMDSLRFPGSIPTIFILILTIIYYPYYQYLVLRCWCLRENVRENFCVSKLGSLK